ncbi:MAG: AsmA family protein [Acetobacteraceae bacterium]|nr:AsmA family protein [Acetobacteraceae bacterium]
MDAAASPPRSRRLLRWLLIVPAVLLVLGAVAVGAAVALFDPEAQKPRIAAAVEAATGRRLTLAGPVGLKFSFVPTVTLEDVSLANMPGGSRPEMARVGRVEAELALLPLLSRRLELRRVVLRAPDILLETDAEGRPNWAFAPTGGAEPGAPAAAADAPPVPAAEAEGGVAASAPRPPPVSVERITVTDGRVAYRDGATGRTRTLEIGRFGTEPVAGQDGLLRFDGGAALDGLPIALEGTAGGPARLFAAGPAAPWPLRAAVAAAGAELRVEGAVERPLQARDWRFAVAAKVPDASRFAAALPNLPTPPLRDIDLAATLSDPGPEDDAAGPLPRFADLSVSIGANDLAWLWPGLRLSGLRVSVPRDDAPFTLEGQAAVGNIPLRASGSLGAPRAFLAGVPAGAPPGPWPVDLGIGAGAATGSLKGSIADVANGPTGIDLELALRVPDLAALSPLAGRPLPALRDLSFDTRVAERGPGFAAGVFLRGLRFASSAGDAAGDVTYAIGQRQGPLGELASRRLDLDALLPPPSAAAPASGADTSAAAPKARSDGRLIPDMPLPLDALRIVQGNLRWTFEELAAGGVPLRQVLVAVAVEDGRGRLDPFRATLPGGQQILVRGNADGTVDPPALQVAAQGTGLDLAPLLAALRAPPRLAGHLDLDADLRGAGRDLRTLAGGLSGHLGLALVDGSFDAALLQSLPAELRRALVSQAGAGDRVPLHCGALRVQAENGASRLRALSLETALGRLGGEGGLNLRDETLAVKLLPDLRLGGVALRAPVNVAGTLAAPRVGVSPEAAAAAGLGALLSLQQTPDRELQGLAGALGGGGGAAGGPALPDCASQLAVARGGRAGAMPSSRPAPVAAAPAPPAGGRARALPGPAEEVLRGLFGRGR